MVVLTICSAWSGSALGSEHAAPTTPSCDDSLKRSFKPDDSTTVVLVKAFKKGDTIVLSEPVSTFTPRATNDVCLVKLIVGPGNPGPAGAPSSSPGIGVEVWLPTPANWNQRFHALGGGGYVGGPHGSIDAIGEPRAAITAATEGAISSATDAGHPRNGAVPGRPGGGDFGMNPDGALNKTLWKDFSSRSMHEQAVKAKAFATVYYGSPRRLLEQRPCANDFIRSRGGLPTLRFAVAECA